VVSGRLNVSKDLKRTNEIVRTEQFRHLISSKRIPLGFCMGRYHNILISLLASASRVCFPRRLGSTVLLDVFEVGHSHVADRGANDLHCLILMYDK
jgi:hypothetical protein